jgi:uncharacterized phage-associated protein
MANVFDVAKYILENIGGEISSMKLQKLCYYSQAWNMVWDNDPLFDEDFLRWDGGPVCEELFRKHQGKFYVSTDIINNELLSNEPITPTEARNIDQVLEDYGKYSGGQLSEITHSESPWRDTQKNQIISKNLIKEYYSSLSAKNV